MNELQRLTPNRIERLKGAVIKEIFTKKIPKGMDVIREGFLSVVSIQLEDGRTLFVDTRDTEAYPEVEMTIRPKESGGAR